ncbi:MAG: hypothetical protein IPL79_07585 [Myxococcales bacterium]|nr:hypothetical protein [Myxococcales bacterium]
MSVVNKALLGCLGAVTACNAPPVRHAAAPLSSTADAAQTGAIASDAWYELALHGEKIGYAHETMDAQAHGVTMRREERVAFTRAGAPVDFHAIYDATFADGRWSGEVTTAMGGATSTRPLMPDIDAVSCIPAVFAATWLAMGQSAPACGIDPAYEGLRLAAGIERVPQSASVGTAWRITWHHPWGELTSTVTGSAGQLPDVVTSSDGATAQKTTAHLAQVAWTPPDLLALTAVKAQRVADGVLVPARHRPQSPALAAMRFPGQREAVTADGYWVNVTLTPSPLPAAALPLLPGEVATTPRVLTTMMAALHKQLAPSLQLGTGLGDCRAMSAQLGADLAQRRIAFRYATGWRLEAASSRLIRHRWLVVRATHGWISIDPAFAEVPAQPVLIGLVLEDPSQGPPQGDLVFDLAMASSRPRSRDE